MTKQLNDYLARMPAIEKSLRNFFTTLTTRVDFVSITLDNENPYKIFKSLNSIGVDLEQGDLIRNHIFMSMPVAKQDAFDDNQWRPLERHFEKDGKLDGKQFTSFFRDVLMRHGSYVGENAVFEVFERENPLPGIECGVVVANLERSAKHHDIVRGKTKHPSDEVEQAIRSIRSLNATTAYPLVLALLEVHDANKLSLNDLVTCLRAISGFVLRRYVCVRPSRSYGQWFCSACKELGDNPLANLSAFLMDKGWPSDDAFVSDFQQLNLYDGKYGRAVLEGIEQSIQTPCEPVLLDDCWIEHVMPQSITDDADGKAWQAALGDGWRKVHEQWLHTPGNLTLVGSKYNRDMQKKPFAEKKPVLKESRVYLNKHFADDSLTTWTEESIKARGRKLGEDACRVWAGPPTTNGGAVSKYPLEEKAAGMPRLTRPQARVLQALLPVSGQPPSSSRTELAQKMKVSSISGTISVALGGRSDSPHKGLLDAGLVTKVKGHGNESVYQITVEGIKAVEDYLKEHGKLPPPRDPTVSTNIRHQNSASDADSQDMLSDEEFERIHMMDKDEYSKLSEEKKQQYERTFKWHFNKRVGGSHETVDGLLVNGMTVQEFQDYHRKMQSQTPAPPEAQMFYRAPAPSTPLQALPSQPQRGPAFVDDPHDLNRFVQAQKGDYKQGHAKYELALAEIRNGDKRTHWMWYIFPQFDGLSSRPSPNSKRYAIKSIAEAKAYLSHPVLGPRLMECAEAALSVQGRTAHAIFDSPDDTKLRSCATLFARVSQQGSVFHRLLDKYYQGERDSKTLRLLGIASDVK